MKTSLKMMIAAGALGFAGLVASAPATTASAQGFALSFNIGNVAFGYTDGYYDNHRRWHRWRSTRERDWYMRNHRGSYHAMRHDRDRDRNNRWRDWDRKRHH
jgi:hypothetical protein